MIFEGFRRIAVLLFEKLLGWVKKTVKVIRTPGNFNKARR